MKTIFYLLLVSASFSCLAQNTTPKNEIGINIYGLEVMLNPKKIGNALQPFYFSGAHYKRQISEKYHLRFAGQYFSQSESDAGVLIIQSVTVAYDGTFAYNIDEKGFETRAGVERTFLKKKIRPFVFADLAYRYVNTQVTYLMNDEWLKGGSQRHYVGLLGGIGVKYYPTNQIYISLESSIGYYKNFRLEGYNEVLFSPVKTIAFGVRF